MTLLNDILGPIARTGITWLGRKRLPKIEGAIRISGLSKPVEIIRDRWGIPHIFAQNEDDLFFAQGFVHAQDRLWQMELNRRTARGQLAELFGEIALDTDRATRTFGFNRLGQVDWQNAQDETRQAVLAYTAGVNAYLNMPSAPLPVEFTLLGHHPRPWEPEDCTAFARVMMWQLSHAWFGEIVRAQMVEAVGAEHTAELDIHYPPLSPTTLPKGIEFNRLEADGKLIQERGPFLERSSGSNSWAVAGNKTDTGKPYLCNDMHLALGMPGLWYQVHLIGGSFNVTGVSLPGEPLVLVGHNAQIAWGITLAYTDCEDLFVEQFDAEKPGLYKYQDAWVQGTVIDEVIHVKGKAEPHHEKVVVTRHGPVVSDVVGYPQQRIAVNSKALQPSPNLLGWLKLDQARNWDEFVKAMRLLEAPQLNICYADVAGNTGYWCTGRTPIRAKGDGRTPAPGWSGEYEWVDEVPFEQMPHGFNPEKGFVVTTNNKIVPDDYPYYLGAIWMNGFRARRIEEVLSSKDKLSAQDFRNLHIDVTCLPGKQWVEKVGDVQSSDPSIQKAITCLKAWNGQLDPQSVGGCIYEVARYFMARNLVQNAIGEERAMLWMGKGFNPVLFTASEFYGHDITTLLRLFDQPDSWWMQQAGGKEKLITEGISQAVAWLTGKFGDNPQEWQWGKLHTATFAHAMGMQKPLDQVFNRGPYPIGGDTDTPMQTAMLPNDPYENKAWSPTFRQIVDMSDLSKSVTISPPGQSGQIGSKHYDDFIGLWLKGEYAPMLWTREQIEKEAEGKLILSGSD
jgi:penicillin G amidase